MACDRESHHRWMLQVSECVNQESVATCDLCGATRPVSVSATANGGGQFYSVSYIDDGTFVAGKYGDPVKTR